MNEPHPMPWVLPIRGALIGKLDLFVPGRPHPKKRPRSQKGGGRSWNPKENRQAEGEIIRLFRKKYGQSEWMDMLPHHGPFLLECFFMYSQTETVRGRAKWFEGKDMDSTPDLDNPLKTVMDALNGVAWADDKYILGLHAEKMYWDGQSGTYMIMSFFEPTSKG